MRLALVLVPCSGCYLVDNGPTECVPLNCEGQGWDCGPADDGCGGALECGPCGGASICGEGGDAGGLWIAGSAGAILRRG